MTTTIRELLGPDGPVAARVRAAVGAGAYEHRPEQVRMGEAVAKTLEERGRLLVEAGTGVGKSFAYLVPAILRCIQRGEKVVIATSTIALQEQLIGKDIPLLAETAGQWAGGGSSGVDSGQSEEVAKPAVELLPVLAKGRGNYLSVRRLGIGLQRQDSILPDGEARAALHVIEKWAYATRDGTLSSLPVLERPEVWEHVRSDSDNCMGRKCATYQKCFYQAARRELEKANLIVCNHALFFADLALRTMHGRQGGEGTGTTGKAERHAEHGGTQTQQIKAILPNYDHVIFDEAHGLEDAACEHFGLSLSMPRVMRLLRTLYSQGRRKGFLLERSLSIGNAGTVDRALTLVQQAEHACVEFFEDLLEFRRASSDGSGRMRRPEMVQDSLSPVMRELAVSLRRIRDGLDEESERLELGALAKRASEIAECCAAMVMQTLGGEGDGESPYAYWVEVEGAEGQRGRGGPARGALAAHDEESAGGAGGPAHAGIVHGGGRRRFGPRVTLACAPIEVSALLRRYLFDPGAKVEEAEIDEGGDGEAEVSVRATLNGEVHSVGANGDAAAVGRERGGAQSGSTPASSSSAPAPSSTAAPAPPPPKRIGIVLTSATLATRGAKVSADGVEPARADRAFAHVMGNLGVTGAQTLQLGSPFDYRKQARLIVDLSVPDPKARPGGANEGPSFADALAARVLSHVETTRGGAFVLFTSFATMYGCADRLRGALDQRGWPMFVQGRDGSRQMILKKFVEGENGVLLGAASFWQGVDVRGERLRNVIITRLPFEPPDRPLVQARNERIELMGGNPFMQDSLPRAIIRFKQGFGRLIRSKTDTGQVVVLDPRVVTARYGKMFLEALPGGIPTRVIRAEGEEEFVEGN